MPQNKAETLRLLLLQFHRRIRREKYTGERYDEGYKDVPFHIESLIGWRLLEDRLQQRVDFFAAHAVLHNLAVGVEKEEVRDALDVEPIGQILPRVEDLWIVDAQVSHGFLGAVYFVLYGDAQHYQALVLVVVVCFHPEQGLILAGTTPGGPEIGQDILALADIVVQGAFFLGDGAVGLELDDGGTGQGQVFVITAEFGVVLD